MCDKNEKRNNFRFLRHRLSKRTASIIVLDERVNHNKKDWIDASDDLLRESLHEIITSEEDILPESLLSEWKSLMDDYFGPYDQAAGSAYSYLSQPKKLMMDVYGDSEILRKYVERLFRIITTYLLSKKKNIKRNGKEIVCYKDKKGRTVHVFEDDHGEFSAVTELLESDIALYGKLKRGEVSYDEMSELWG